MKDAIEVIVLCFLMCTYISDILVKRGKKRGGRGQEGYYWMSLSMMTAQFMLIVNCIFSKAAPSLLFYINIIVRLPTRVLVRLLWCYCDDPCRVLVGGSWEWAMVSVVVLYDILKNVGWVIVQISQTQTYALFIPLHPHLLFDSGLNFPLLVRFSYVSKFSPMPRSLFIRCAFFFATHILIPFFSFMRCA
jgi:hypothetical protein